MAHRSDAYADTVTGIDDLVAYWRFTDDSAIVDVAGDLDGTYDDDVTEVAALPSDSDGAIRLGGLARATVGTDSSLDLAAFTLSLWVVVHEDFETIRAIVAREASGLNPGDFGLYWLDGELYAQFQSASAQIRAFGSISTGVAHHIAVTADGSGFSLWIDGQLQDTNASFTGGWADNGNDLVFGSAQQLTDELDITIDEVAVYSRVLTDAEIGALSQNTNPPVAQDRDFTVGEDATTQLDVVSNATFVGDPGDLTVQVLDGETWTNTVATTHGTATVSGNKINFAANDISEQQVNTFDYRITDANGPSNTATVTLTITVASGADDGNGGTLVYDWQADGDWITDDGTPEGTFIALSSRGEVAVRGSAQATDPSPNRWNDGASVGSVRRVGKRSNWNSAEYRKLCWNFAPDDTPALEMVSTQDSHGVADFWLELFEPLVAAGHRRMRVVMELRFCDSSDATTYKSQGKGTTTGSYPEFNATHQPNPSSTNDHCAIKFFACVTCGETPRGAAVCNWWNDERRPIDGAGHMMQTGKTSKDIGLYHASFGRANNGGFVSGSPVKVTDVGVQGGCWFKLENEVDLGDADDTPLNAIRKVGATRPTGGVGVQRSFITKDMDGDLGTAGTRQQMQEFGGMTFSPRLDHMPDNDDNMHILCDCTGPWLDFFYGGSEVCQKEGWVWLRRIQVYGYDE